MAARLFNSSALSTKPNVGGCCTGTRLGSFTPCGRRRELEQVHKPSAVSRGGPCAFRAPRSCAAQAKPVAGRGCRVACGAAPLSRNHAAAAARLLHAPRPTFGSCAAARTTATDRAAGRVRTLALQGGGHGAVAPARKIFGDTAGRLGDALVSPQSRCGCDRRELNQRLTSQTLPPAQAEIGGTGTALRQCCCCCCCCKECRASAPGCPCRFPNGSNHK